MTFIECRERPSYSNPILVNPNQIVSIQYKGERGDYWDVFLLMLSSGVSVYALGLELKSHGLINDMYRRFDNVSL